MHKERVVIFGAGLAGQRACRFLRHQFNVVAFADNDPRKQGTRMLRRPVVAPGELSTLRFDRIHIASMHSHEISRQLLNEHAVDPITLKSVPRAVMLGEYEIGPWTYIVVGAAAVLLLMIVTVAGYAIQTIVTHGRIGP